MFGKPCCDRQNEVNQNFVGENDINMDVDINMNQGQTMMNGTMGAMNAPMGGSVSQPIFEPVQERVVNRTILHEVPHV